MAPVIILLRIIHILSAIVWLGGSFTIAAFVMPTARRVGPGAGPFMQNLAAASGLPVVLLIAGWLTVIAGVFLYPSASGGFDRGWMRSAHGMTLGIGAVFGVLAVMHGSLAQSPAAEKLAALSREIAAAGGTPTAEQGARIVALQGRLARGGIAGVAMMTIAAIAMSIARYM